MHRHAYALGLLLLASCLGARDHALFDSTAEVNASGGSTAGTTPASTGTDSSPQPSGGNEAVGSSGTSTGATSASSTGGSAGGSGAGGGGMRSDTPPPDVPKISDCSMVEGASVGDNGHCYRVNEEELTFSAASAACQAAGGHLVTIGDDAENDLAAELHDGEHWIGATDGLPDTTAGVGTYAWVVDEPFSFSDWEDGQPNAYETNCPDQGDESDCFEHCAFQSDEGDWLDRSCWHTIASICEWDVEAKAPEGAAGAAGAGS